VGLAKAPVLIFVGAMAAGMWLFHTLHEKKKEAP
jgi:hypothetical protein